MVKNKRLVFMILALSIIVFAISIKLVVNYFSKPIVDATDFNEQGELFYSFTNASLTYSDNDLYFNYKLFGIKLSERINKRSVIKPVSSFSGSSSKNEQNKLELRFNKQYDWNINSWDLYLIDSFNSKETRIADRIESFDVHDGRLYTLFIREQYESDGTIVYVNVVKEYDCKDFNLISTTQIQHEKYFENMIVKDDFAVFTINRREIYCYDFNTCLLDRVIPDYSAEQLLTLFNPLYVTDKQLYFCYCLASFDGPDLNTIKEMGLYCYDVRDKKTIQMSSKSFDSINIFDDKYVWCIDGYKLYRINIDTLGIDSIR